MSAIRHISLTAFGEEITGLSVAIGASVAFDITFQDPALRNAFNLTSCIAEMSLARLDPRGSLIQPPIFARQATITNAVGGRATVVWAPGDTANSGGNGPLSPGIYGFDLWVTDINGNRLEFGFGSILIAAVATLPSTLVTPLPPVPPLGAAASQPNSENAVRTIYVRSGGDDSNDGSSVGSAVATVQRALNLLYNLSYNLYQIIDCTGLGVQLVASPLVIPPVVSSALVTQDPNPPTPAFSGFITALTVRATPTVEQTVLHGNYSTAFLQMIGGGGPSPSNFAVVSVPGQTWTVNQWKHAVLYVHGTSNTGVIIANTSNTLTVAIDNSFAFNGTPAFDILSPSAEFRYTGTDGQATVQAVASLAGLSFEGLRISRVQQSPGADAALAVGLLEDLRLELCDLDGLSIEGNIAENPVALSCSFRGDSGGANIFSTDDAAPDCLNCFFDGITLSQSSDGGSFGAQYIWCEFDGCNSVGHSDNQDAEQRFNLQNCLIKNGTEHGVLYTGGLPSRVISSEIAACAGDAVHATGAGTLLIQGVKGTQNTGVGVLADDGVHVQVDSNTTVTGTGGNLSVGLLATRTWADFLANPPIKNQIDSSTLTRVWMVGAHVVGGGIPDYPGYNSEVVYFGGTLKLRQVEQAKATFDGSSAQAAVTWPTFAARSFDIFAADPVTNDNEMIEANVITSTIGPTGCTIQANKAFTGTVPVLIREILS